MLGIPTSPASAGLFFVAGLTWINAGRRWLRSHIRMNPDLENVIRQALGVSKAVGRDDLGQTVLAVQAVQQARPDMISFSWALDSLDSLFRFAVASAKL